MTALDWDGCLNVRDLGGLPTEDGEPTRAGAVVRSDNIRTLTDAGWRSLAEHGVQPDRRPALAGGARGGRAARRRDRGRPRLGARGDLSTGTYVAELDAHLGGVDDIADHYAWSYVDFLERYRERFGRAFAAVADADGPVVVHCMGGKDRTGLVAAVLLRLAGVGLETIGADYALSSANLEPRSAEWIEQARDDDERAKREKLSGTPAAGMVRTLEEIERRYGDVASYLRAAGLTDAQIERLRERLAAP